MGVFFGSASGFAFGVFGIDASDTPFLSDRLLFLWSLLFCFRWKTLGGCVLCIVYVGGSPKKKGRRGGV